MDTRSLGYLGLGALVVIVLVTLVGVPPVVWLTAALIAAVVGLSYAVLKARDSGLDIAARMAEQSPQPNVAEEPVTVEAPAPAPVVTTSPVEVELVRAADSATGTSAVWLHRFGGRRVHRYQAADAWVVEQVSTKDPDNPKKRVIGEPLTFAREADATAAADDLAQGVRPTEPVPTPTTRPTFAAHVHA